MADPSRFPGADGPQGFSAKKQKNLRRHYDKDEVCYLLCSFFIFPNSLPRELSKGIFSPNNQRHLTGSDTDVSIFEAEVPESEELRIVVSVNFFLQVSNN